LWAAASCSRRRFLQGLGAATIGSAAVACGATGGIASHLTTATETSTRTPRDSASATPTATATPDPNAILFAELVAGLAPEVQSYLYNDARFAHPGPVEVQLAKFLVASGQAETVGMFDTPTSPDPALRRGRELIPWDPARQIRMLETNAFRAVPFGSHPGMVGVTSYLVPALEPAFANRVLDIAERRTAALFRVAGDVAPHEEHVSVQYEPFAGMTSFAWGMSFVLDDDVFEKRDSDASVDHVFCHEFTHCLQYESLSRAPVWFVEGSADYVASAARDANIPRGASGYAAAADGGKVTLNLASGQASREAYPREGGNGHLFLTDLALTLGPEGMAEALRTTFSVPHTGTQIVAAFQAVADRAGASQSDAVRLAISKWT